MKTGAWFAFSLILLVFTLVPAAAQERVALVIGNSAYTNISALQNPRNDAELMAETLGLAGFEVVVALDVDRLAMARAVRRFGTALREAGEEAVGLFFYAGHGVQYHGDNYLIPLSAQIEFAADLPVEAFRVSDILSQMQEARNAVNIIVLDACRNNPFPEGTRGGDRGLARPVTFNGSFTAFAAAPGQVALDGDGANSPYTSALAQAMLTPGLTVEQVFKRTRVSVLGATEGRQTPWEESSLIDEFVFVEEPPEQELGANEGQLNETDALEVAFWNGTLVLDNIVAYQEYLQTYPDGTFVNLAEIRLRELREELASISVSALEEEEARSAGDQDTAPPARDDPYAQALVAHNTGDYEQAALLYEQAAEIGNSSAMLQLAHLYAEGRGVDQNVENAIGWYERAANLGDAEAMFMIGRIYERGTGVARDFELAVEWYVRAAENGNADAMNNLGVLHSFGEGVPQDTAAALQWFVKGAEAGSVNSMFNLAAMYDEGKGTEPQPAQAAHYMLQALRSGNSLVVQEMTTNANAWSGEFRMELQRLLQAEGFYNGGIDGSFGPGTRAAILAAAGQG